MRFFTKNIILINRIIIGLSICVTLGTLLLTAQFFKKQKEVEIRKMKVLEELRKEEEKRIKSWADALSQTASISLGESPDPCLLDIIKSNKTIPVILLGPNEEYKAHRNLNPLEFQLQKEIQKLEKTSSGSMQIRILKDSLDIIKHEFEERLKIDTILQEEIDSMRYKMPIQSLQAKKDQDGNMLLDSLNNPITEAVIDYIYYKDSYVIKEFNKLSNDSKEFNSKLQKLPIIILLITISIFLVAYMAFYYSKKSQQNKLWAGIAKETAHQIGTPLSSLMGWVEYLKTQNIKNEIIAEIEKDTTRLQQIADRFSKIGSLSLLTPVQIIPILEKTIDYVKKRASKNIKFLFEFEEGYKGLKINLSPELFSWVIENLLKNSIDSLQKKGVIKIVVKHKINNQYIIDVIDNGKGIPSYDFKKIFDPGHTSKKRGWGLGLSLCQRIITEYHQGKIFVLKSNPFKETIIRIIITK